MALAERAAERKAKQEQERKKATLQQMFDEALASIDEALEPVSGTMPKSPAV